MNLKLALSHYLNRTLDRVRAEFDNPTMQELRAKAYPPEKEQVPFFYSFCKKKRTWELAKFQDS